MAAGAASSAGWLMVVAFDDDNGFVL